MESEPRRLNTLDTLRGIASFSVCLFHYTGAVLPKVRVPMLTTMFSWGWAGVEIFFVISGFIIPYILITYNYNIKTFWQFIGKRFVRIFPPSTVAIILLLIQWWLFDYVFHANHTYLTNVSWLQVLSNLTYTAPFTNHEWLNSIYWTLSVEFQFYILIGLVFNFTFKNIYTFIGFSMTLVALFYAAVYLPILTRGQFAFLFFNWGILFLMGGLATMHMAKRITLPAYLAILTIFVIVCYMQHGPLVTFFGFATTLTISFVVTKNKVGSFFGKISFSLYLVHILCAPIFEIIFTKIISTSSITGKVIVQMLCLSMAIVCAYIFYLVIEKYFISLATKLFGTGPRLRLDNPQVPTK